MNELTHENLNLAYLSHYLIPDKYTDSLLLLHCLYGSRHQYGNDWQCYRLTFKKNAVDINAHPSIRFYGYELISPKKREDFVLIYNKYIQSQFDDMVQKYYPIHFGLEILSQDTYDLLYQKVLYREKKYKEAFYLPSPDSYNYQLINSRQIKKI